MTTTNLIDAAAFAAGYCIDCYRNKDGAPSTIGTRNWFVANRHSGAIVAHCSTRESAERALAKRLAKEARS